MKTKDVVVRECEKRIRQAQAAIVLARHALDGIEDPKQRSELEYRIINLGIEESPEVEHEAQRLWIEQGGSIGKG